MAFDLIYQTLDFSILGNIELSVKDGSARLLANPKLRLSESTTGKVVAKTQRNYVTVDDNKTVVRSMDLGTEVEVRPVVFKNGEVSLDVKIMATNVLKNNTKLPSTTSHTINGTVRVKLGETITAVRSALKHTPPRWTRCPFLETLEKRSLRLTRMS